VACCRPSEFASSQSSVYVVTFSDTLGSNPPAMTRRASSRSLAESPAYALTASATSFFFSKRLMLNITFLFLQSGVGHSIGWRIVMSTHGYTTPGRRCLRPGKASPKMPLVNLLLTTMVSLQPVLQLSSQSKGARYSVLSRPPFLARSLSGKWQ